MERFSTIKERKIIDKEDKKWHRAGFPHPARRRLGEHGAEEDPSRPDSLVQGPGDRLGGTPLSPGSSARPFATGPTRRWSRKSRAVFSDCRDYKNRHTPPRSLGLLTPSELITKQLKGPYRSASRSLQRHRPSLSCTQARGKFVSCLTK